MAELVGQQTDLKTSVGRDIYKTDKGELVSEKSVTFKIGDMFVNAPSIYLLLAILIKIIPEAIIVYSYYNRLKIKFPKIDFIVYLMIIPFYLFIIIFNNII